MATISYILDVDTSKGYKKVLDLYAKSNDLFSKGVSLRLNNQFSRPLGQITGDVKQFDASMDAATARVIAFSSTTSILYSVGAAMKRLITDAVGVESALAKIQAVSLSSTSSVKVLGDQLFNIANKTSQSFFGVAAAAEEFSRQGLSLQETLKAVSAASTLAKLSGTDLRTSIDGLVAIMSTFSEQALEYKEIVNTLASVDAQFATSAAGLVDGLKRVSGVAAEAGLTFQDTAATIASIKQLTGRSESVIGNGLKTIITNFRTEAVGKQLENIGVYTKDAQGNFRDLTSVIAETQKAFESLGQQAVENISLKIAGKYQINNFKGLIKAFDEQGGGSSLFDKAQNAARPDDGLAQKRIDILNNTTESRVKKLDNNITRLGAGLGDQVLKPAYDQTIEFLTVITDALDKFGKTAAPIFKGFADALSGPALLTGGAALVALFFKLSREVAGALGSVLNLNKAESQTVVIQNTINQALANGDKILVDQVRNATTLQQRMVAINALVSSYVAMQSAVRSAQFADAGLVNSTNRRAIIRNKAGGFIPSGFEDAFAREQVAINQGVGGASRLAKPVVRRLNLNGTVEPVVVNTDEAIVKNFMGSGKDSVLNRDMIKKLGPKAKYLGRVENLALGKTPNILGDKNFLQTLNNAIAQLQRIDVSQSKGGIGVNSGGIKVNEAASNRLLQKLFSDPTGRINPARFTEENIKRLVGTSQRNPGFGQFVRENFVGKATNILSGESLRQGDIQANQAVKTSQNLNSNLFGSERRAKQLVEKALGISFSSFTAQSLSGDSQSALKNRNQLRIANELVLEKKREIDVTRLARREAFNKLQQDTRSRLQSSLNLANSAANTAGGFLTQQEKRRVLEEAAKSSQRVGYTTVSGSLVTGSGGGKLSIVDRSLIKDILKREAPSSFSDEAKKLSASITKAVENKAAEGKLLRPSQIQSIYNKTTFSGGAAEREQFLRPILNKAIEESRAAFSSARQIGQENRLNRAFAKLATENSARMAGAEVVGGALSSGKSTILQKLFGISQPANSQLDSRTRELSAKLNPSQVSKLQLENQQIKEQNAASVAQSKQSRIFAASFAVPVITGTLSTFFKKRNELGQEKDTKASILTSDLGQAASSGLSTSFLLSAFAKPGSILSRFAGPVGLGIAGVQGFRAVNKLRSTGLEGKIKDDEEDRAKKQTRLDSLSSYINQQRDLEEARKNDLPRSKIRELESKLAQTGFSLDRGLLNKVRSASTEKEKSEVLSKETTSEAKRDIGRQFNTVLTDIEKKTYESLSYLDITSRIGAANGQKGVFEQGVNTKYNEQKIFEVFSQLGSSFSPETLLKNGQETEFVKSLRSSVPKNLLSGGEEAQSRAIKNINDALRSAGYGSATTGISTLQKFDPSTVVSALEIFVKAVDTTTKSLKEIIPTKEEISKRKENEARLFSLDNESSFLQRSAGRKFEANSADRELLLSINDSILKNKLDNGAISNEDFASESFKGVTTSITSEISKQIEKINLETNSNFKNKLVEGSSKFSDEDKIDLLEVFNKNGPSEGLIDRFLTANNRNAAKGNTSENIKSTVQELRNILAIRGGSISDVKSGGTRELAAATARNYLEIEKNKQIRRDERISALSPYGETLNNNLSKKTGEIFGSSRSNATNTFLPAFTRTSEFLNKPEYLLSPEERKFDSVRKADRNKTEINDFIRKTKENPDFLPLGPGAFDSEIEIQRNKKQSARTTIKDKLSSIYSEDLKTDTLGRLSSQFATLDKLQSNNPTSFTFGDREARNNIASSVKNGNFLEALGSFKDAKAINYDDGGGSFADRTAGTAYGENIQKIIDDITNTLLNSSKKSTLASEIAAKEAEKILPYDAGDKNNPKTESSQDQTIMAGFIEKLDAISQNFANPKKQEATASYTLLVGFEKIFNDDTIKKALSSAVTGRVKQILEANLPNGTPAVIPP